MSAKRRMQAVDFVDLWNRAATLEDVIAACGVLQGKVTSRAHALRKLGVPLKHFSPPAKHGGYYLDVPALVRAAELALAGLPREAKTPPPRSRPAPRPPRPRTPARAPQPPAVDTRARLELLRRRARVLDLKQEYDG